MSQLIIPLTPSDARDGQYFGRNVAVEGNYALVAAPGALGGGNMTIGAVYLYDFSDPANIIETKLQAPQPMIDDHFGVSIAMDNQRAIVGAPFMSAQSEVNSAAYVYDFSDPNNIEVITIPSPTPDRRYDFGYDVDLSGDLALVSDPLARKVYVYDISSPDAVEQVVVLEDPGSGNSFGFGINAAISGNTVVVTGSNLFSFGTSSNYIYDISDPDNLIQTAVPTPSWTILPTNDDFSIDGNRAILGFDDFSSTSSVVAYDMTDVASPIGFPVDHPDDDFLSGLSTAIDGNIVAIAGYSSDGIRLFDITDLNHISLLPPLVTPPGTGWGFSVDISGDWVITGDFNPDDGIAYLINIPEPASVSWLAGAVLALRRRHHSS